VFLKKNWTQKSGKMTDRIELVQGDITKLNVDAIVNAANRSLLGGGGVDGAIHRVAGPDLLRECEQLIGCETGEAKITKGYKLQAKYVIHTVGPVYRDGMANESELLANCYRNSLKLAVDNKIKTIAFPNISTGVYRFPKIMAAGIAIRTTVDFLQKNKKIEKVYFVCYDVENYSIYKEKLAAL